MRVRPAFAITPLLHLRCCLLWAGIPLPFANAFSAAVGKFSRRQFTPDRPLWASPFGRSCRRRVRPLLALHKKAAHIAAARVADAHVCSTYGIPAAPRMPPPSQSGSSAAAIFCRNLRGRRGPCRSAAAAALPHHEGACGRQLVIRVTQVVVDSAVLNLGRPPTIQHTPCNEIRYNAHCATDLPLADCRGGIPYMKRVIVEDDEATKKVIT